jgi:hypothetical protein
MTTFLFSYELVQYCTCCLFICTINTDTEQSGIALNLYSGGACLKSWLGHWLSWLRFFVLLLSHSRQMPDIIWIKSQPLHCESFVILHSLETYHLTLYKYSLATDCILKSPTKIINTSYYSSRWSQWLHSLRHEMSLPAGTLGSWVWIPLKAWMSVCICSVFFLSCVSSSLSISWSPIQGILPTV